MTSQLYWFMSTSSTARQLFGSNILTHAIRSIGTIKPLMGCAWAMSINVKIGPWLTWLDAVNPVNRAVPKGMTTLAAAMTAGTRIGIGTGKVGIVTGLALTMG